MKYLSERAADQQHTSTNVKSPIKVLSSHGITLKLISPKHFAEKNPINRLFRSPGKQSTPNCSPSKRKDYLDAEAFNISPKKAELGLVTIKVDKPCQLVSEPTNADRNVSQDQNKEGNCNF